MFQTATFIYKSKKNQKELFKQEKVLCREYIYEYFLEIELSLLSSC